MSAEPMTSAFAHATPLTYAPAPKRDIEALVKQHLPLVRRIAWHVHGSMSTIVDIEDLVQIGLVALVEAVSVPHERGAGFGAYLSTRLRGAMIDELRRQATTTRGAMRRRRQYHDAIAQLTAATGETPGEAMIAAHLGITLDKLRTVRTRLRRRSASIRSTRSMPTTCRGSRTTPPTRSSSSPKATCAIR